MITDAICEGCWNPLRDDDAFHEENLRVFIVGKGYQWLKTIWHAECMDALTATKST